MMNYKTIFAVFILTLMLKNTLAQPPKPDQIESLRIGFISNRLQLTPEEAQKFWPVYNKFSAEMDKLRTDMRMLMKEEAGMPEKLSESEAEKVLNEMVNFKVKEAELIKKYASEFKKVLPASKVVLLYKAENDFKTELLRRLRERRNKPD
ncbi:MAG: Spy/CpxP family protein refolding chaperone [Bacteroidia bacterium]